MHFTNDKRNPRRIIGDISRDEFNTIMSELNQISTYYTDNESENSTIIVRHCKMLIGQLTKYSYFDVDNDIVKVTFFAEEVGLLLGYMVGGMNQSDKVDYFNDLATSGDVRIWENR